MGIDRDDYEPITGNPRREDNQEDLGEGDNGQARGGRGGPQVTGGDPGGAEGSPENPVKGARGTGGEKKSGSRHTGSGGSPSGPVGAPSGSNGAPKGLNGDPIGDPMHPNGGPAEQRGDPMGPPPKKKTSSERGPQSPAPSRKTGDRKRRVKVTPEDWDTLEQISEDLSVGYAKVYRIAFRQFLSRYRDRGGHPGSQDGHAQPPDRV